TWGPALFVELGVHELARSALLASLLGVAALPGLYTVGVVSDGLVTRGVSRTVVAAGAMLCMTVLTAAMGAVVQAHGPAWLLATLVFAASFFMWGGWAPIYATLAELFPPPGLGIAHRRLKPT